MAALPPKGSALPVLQKYVQAMVKERGFEDETLAQCFMLLIEEVGELAKAARKSAGMKVARDTKKQDVEGEAADVLILLLDICTLLGIDLEQAFYDKESKNDERIWE